jgi:AsmA protein
MIHRSSGPKYKSNGPSRAAFDYSIKATDFDIKKAYDSIKIFRELASTAEYAQGIVSLDYSLKGVLNRNMEPVYPSIEGGGTIYLKDVKVRGYKLFSAVSKRTGRDSVDITGTQNEPVIKLGRKTKDLKETRYEEEPSLSSDTSSLQNNYQGLR